MAYFQPPAVHYGSGDIGDVFHALSKEGREERALKSQAERLKLQQFINEPGLMEAAKGTDAYLGATNPFDLTQRVQPYEARTGRMNSETSSGRLQFEKDWEPDRSARGWAESGNADRRTGLEEKRVGLGEREQQFKEENYPNSTALDWANYGLNADKVAADNRHSSAIESATQQNAETNAKEASARLKQTEQQAMIHLAQYLPPDVAAMVAKQVASAAVPGLDDKIQAEKENDPVYRALAARQKGGTSGATAAREQSARSATAAGVQGGKEMDRAAEKERITEENSKRKQDALSRLWPEIQQTRKTLQTGQEYIAPSHGAASMGGASGYTQPLSAQRRRELAIKEKQLNDEYLNLTTPLPVGSDPERPTPEGTTDLFPDVPIDPTDPRKKKPSGGVMPNIFVAPK